MVSTVSFSLTTESFVPLSSEPFPGNLEEIKVQSMET